MYTISPEGPSTECGRGTWRDKVEFVVKFQWINGDFMYSRYMLILYEVVQNVLSTSLIFKTYNELLPRIDDSLRG